MGNPLNNCLFGQRSGHHVSVQGQQPPKVSKYKEVPCFPKKTVFIFKIILKNLQLATPDRWCCPLL